MNGGLWLYFFFQAEDGIRDCHVTGVQTCALPISIVIFDKTNRRFLQHDYSHGAYVRKLPEGTLFDYNIGKELVFMVANTYNRGQVFAILKDRSEERRVGKECRYRDGWCG